MGESPWDDARAWLVANFPQALPKIVKLYGADAELRQICDDLGEAVRALHYWKSKGGQNADREREYRDLVDELGAELKAHLDKIRLL